MLVDRYKLTESSEGAVEEATIVLINVKEKVGI